MLRWALVFLVLAVITGFLGFGSVAGLSMDFARILFVIFLVLFVVSLLSNISSGTKPRLPPV